MENDPYGFGYQLERETAKVLHKNGLAVFERAVRMRFEATENTEQARRRWGEVLRAIDAQRRNVLAYVPLCEQTPLSVQDCLTLAAIQNCVLGFNAAFSFHI